MALPDPLDTDEVHLLTEIGFLAAARADVPRAEVIFGALERVRPRRGFPYVGLAVSYLNAQRADDAVSALNRGGACVGVDEFAEVEALRALALHLAGRSSESRRAAQAATASPLGRALLDLSPAPYQEI